MSAPRPKRGTEAGLRRSLFRTFTAVIASFSVAGAVAVGALALQQRSADRVLQVEGPVLAADRAALQAMTDAETGIRGYLLTKDESFLAPYRSGTQSFSQDIDRAITRAGDMGDHGRTQTMLRAEKAAAENWLTTWAKPMVDSATAAANVTADQQQGKELFDAYRAVHQTVTDRLSAAIARDRALIHDRALWLLAITCGSLAVVIGIAAYGARRTVRRVTGPIDALQSTLTDLTHGDLSARVNPSGPRELVALGQAVNDLADEVDRRSGAFVSTVSHELRTPLTSILGYLELMQDGSVGPIPPDQQDVLDAVQRNSGRLLELVEDLLTVSRLEGNALLLASEPVDLRTIVSSAVSAVGLAGRSLTLSWDAPDAEVTILGDAAQLRRVVSQLLANAVTFTPDGGRIDVNLTTEGCSAVLTVADTGIGIAHEDQRHVFHRFYRPAATERLAAPGSGLGLAISRGVVHQHGGAIQLESQPGFGTTVTISLPLAEPIKPADTVDAVPAPSTPAHEENLAGSSRKRGTR